VNKPSFTSGIGIGGVRVSAANTLAITYINNSAAVITPSTSLPPWSMNACSPMP
jgi:hypothetical protein